MRDMVRNTRTGQEERWFSVFLICFWITAFFTEGAYASYLTSLGYGEALISALKKLSRDNFSDLNPHPAVVALEYDHPTTADRIRAIRERESGGASGGTA